LLTTVDSWGLPKKRNPRSPRNPVTGTKSTAFLGGFGITCYGFFAINFSSRLRITTTKLWISCQQLQLDFVNFLRRRVRSRPVCKLWVIFMTVAICGGFR